jgi:hypothetical protein
VTKVIKKQKYIHEFVTGLYLPVIEMNLTSVEVQGGMRPLNVTWTPELAMDLAGYHNIDAEAELTNLLAENVAREIDREIINDLMGMAPTETPDPIQPRTGGLLTSGEVGNIAIAHQQAVREATVNRWSELGFLDGLDGHVRENVATLLEGQASALINESPEPTRFEDVRFPLVRRVQARLADIEPMPLPMGDLMYFTPTLEEEAEDYSVNWRTSDTWDYEGLYGSKIGVTMEMRKHQFIPKITSSFDTVNFPTVNRAFV